MSGSPDIDAQEAARIAELKAYGILDTPNEPAFDDIVRNAARVFRTPQALISFIDADRQWHKARFGVEAKETPRAISFCTHAIRGPDVLVVPDAREDSRFAENPSVTGDPHIRFYAGAPLTTPSGKRIGTLCVFDSQARPDGLSDDARRTLEQMGQAVMVAVESGAATRPRRPKV